MRRIGQVALVGVIGSAVLMQAQAPKPDAASILAAARQALGGDARLDAVKTFVATGRTKQVRGDNLVPIEFEITCELPEKCVRTDEIPAQESGLTSTGFNGGELIVLPVQPAPVPMPGRAGAGPPPAAQMEAMRTARVATVKQDFVRLLLGMFAASFTSYPLTFTYVGQAEAPQGKADVLEAAGAAGFKLRLFIHSDTHLPIMASWQAPSAPGRGMMPGRAGAPGTGIPSAAGAPSATSPAAPQPATPTTGALPAATPTPAAPPPPSAVPQAAPPAGAAPPPGAAPAGAPQPGPAAPGAIPGGRGAPAAPVEYRVYYGDYRDVNGLQWPFRLRRATGTETTEETTFDRFRINAKIDPRKFEIRK